jgi:hypothetical protein
LLVCTVYSVLYSGIALSRKPFGIRHMYVYSFVLRMTDAMTSQNIDLTSRDSLYNLSNNTSTSCCKYTYKMVACMTLLSLYIMTPGVNADYFNIYCNTQQISYVAKHHTMKAYEYTGHGGNAPPIPDFCTS